MKAPFTQTREYLKWHEAVNHKTFYREFFVGKSESIDFQIDGESEKESVAICASIILELKIGKVLYVPYGPVFLDGANKKTKSEVFEYLKNLANTENCVFVRMEDFSTQAESSGRRNSFFLFRPFKKSFVKEGIFQPRVEWWLDLHETEEEIYNRIHKDHKYSIRRAEKENTDTLIVHENLNKYFEEFWNIMQTTGERDGFSLYDRKYYEAIFIQESKGLKKFLVFTKLHDKFMSVALIAVSGGIANLVFAGSLNEKRELGFNHLMQWTAIQESKKVNCKIYNFGGIYENGYGKKSLQGVTNFKRKFGGYAKFHGNFLDMPVKKIRYILYIIRKMV